MPLRSALVATLFLAGPAFLAISATAQEGKLPSLAQNKAAQDDSQPIEPMEKVVLFNGKDFTGLVGWLSKTGYEDPTNAYTVVDGTIRMSGEGVGFVRTDKKYKNYHLSVEFKWGQGRTNTSKYVRNSGVLLHGSGIDGGTGNKAWMASIEIQLAQGCEGDIIVIGGADKDGGRIASSATGKMVLGPDKKLRWSPEGVETRSGGKQLWWSKHQVGFQELLDTRGENDVASPYGEWTKVDLICWEDTVTVKINGQTVNQVYDVKPSSGYILLENEQYEIFFRNFEIKPVAPEDRFRK
ncbi:MAG: DUF1080 domain-containing protein [Planctomycetales bacterium]